MSRALDELKRKMLLLEIEPKRSLGQNFLISDHVIEKIVAAVSRLQPEMLVEVGPGLGALTDLLREAHGNYTVIELDRVFAKYWREQGLNVIEHDALRYDWSQFPIAGRRVFVSNLPYQISSSIVIERSIDANPFTGMVLMFQKEVAQRMMSKPRSEDYGMLTIIAQTFWEIENLLEASGRDFQPAPRVASRVLVFRSRPDLTIVKKSKYLHFVKSAYLHRRKFLIKNLMEGEGKPLAVFQQAFEALKISPQARAEELSVKQMIDLYQILGYESVP